MRTFLAGHVQRVVAVEVLLVGASCSRPGAPQSSQGRPAPGAAITAAQSVDGDVMSFVWDWASGVPEMLSDGDNLYLVGHETLGQWDGADWAYYLPDALGSIRQETDAMGSVTSAREWTSFGVEVGTA